jgi:hypothetical protein
MFGCGAEPDDREQPQTNRAATTRSMIELLLTTFIELRATLLEGPFALRVA